MKVMLDVWISVLPGHFGNMNTTMEHTNIWGRPIKLNFEFIFRQM